MFRVFFFKILVFFFAFLLFYFFYHECSAIDCLVLND